jgi:hypothetical protein
VDVSPSAYLAALARAHVAVNPPLAAKELAELKYSVVALSDLGMLLAETAHSPALAGPRLEEVRQYISRTRAAVAALEQRTHNLVRTALISWESRSV